MSPLFKPRYREDDLPVLLGRAENGVVGAQYEAAKLLLQQGMPGAIKWLEHATGQGHAPSRLCLAYCYLLGNGVEQDPKRAIKLFEAGVEAGDPQALAILAGMYLSGEPDLIPKDEARAVALAQRSSERGCADGTYLLGRMYLDGVGLARDEAQGRAKILDAAERGSPEARAYMGRCHLYGEGFERHPRKAFEHLKQAAENGAVSAMLPLSACYEYGIGAEIDMERAGYWTAMARSGGVFGGREAQDAQNVRGGRRAGVKTLIACLFLVHFMAHAYADSGSVNRKACFLFFHGLLAALALGWFLGEPLGRSFRFRGLKWTFTMGELLALVVSLSASFGAFAALEAHAPGDPRPFAALMALACAQMAGALFAYLHRRVAHDNVRPGYTPAGAVAVLVGSFGGFGVGLGMLWLAVWVSRGCLI